MNDASPTRVGSFPRTRWTLVGDLQAGGERGQGALAELCEIYWYPVYVYLCRTGSSKEDAEDRTQGFFTRLVERDFLAAAQENRGKLRTFLLTALKRYCISEYRRETRQKRGGGIVVVELDENERVSDNDPEIIFEKQWAISLMDDAFFRTKTEYRDSGKGELFEAICPFLTGREKTDPAYGELAEKLQMTAGAVQVAVHRLRKRYRRAFEEVVGETVEDESQREDEMRYVLKILTG